MPIVSDQLYLGMSQPVSRFAIASGIGLRARDLAQSWRVSLSWRGWKTAFAPLALSFVGRELRALYNVDDWRDNAIRKFFLVGR